MLSTYQSYLFYTHNPAQTLQRTVAEPTVARAEKYYAANIGKVKSVDDFINNFQLFSYAMNAYGLQDMTYGKAFMKKVLTSDLSDQHSFVNTLTDARYKTFAEAFNFTPKGQVANAAVVQSTDQGKDLISRYTQAEASVSAETVSAETQYMTKTLASVTSVGDLTGNARLLGDVLAAYGLASTTSVKTVTGALESDTSDPQSAANQSGQAGLKALAQDFNFDSTGAPTAQRLAQTQKSFATMAASYTALAGTIASAKSAATAETTYVGAAIENATTIDAIVNDSRVVAYIGKAFGEPQITAATLRGVLTSDPANPKSQANMLGSPYAKIAAAFEFNTKGTITREPNAAAQSKSSLAATNSAYLEQTIETEAGVDNPGTELALYFARKAPSLSDAYSILADPALLKVAQTVLSLPAASSTADIDVQAKRISNGIKLSDFKNPVKLNAFISKFAALYDLANPSSSLDTVSLLFGGSSGTGST